MTISKPPLPFQGNKSRWISVLPKLFKQIDADVIVDAYGGSGLLSHIAKLASPRSKVYYNDYDNYSARLAKIDQTNALKERIWQVVKDCEADARLPEHIKSKILDLLPDNADFITISTWLCFSGRYAKDKQELSKCGFYRALSSPKAYAKAGDYLQDVTLVRQDALGLVRSLQATHADKRILLVLDPPYIQTSKEGYKSGISLIHNLELIKLIRPPFLFFSSTSSEAGALLEYSGIACFKMQRDLAIKTTPNKNRNDKDLLFYNLGTLGGGGAEGSFSFVLACFLAPGHVRVGALLVASVVAY